MTTLQAIKSSCCAPPPQPTSQRSVCLKGGFPSAALGDHGLPYLGLSSRFTLWNIHRDTTHSIIIRYALRQSLQRGVDLSLFCSREVTCGVTRTGTGRRGRRVFAALRQGLRALLGRLRLVFAQYRHGRHGPHERVLSQVPRHHGAPSVWLKVETTPNNRHDVVVPA